MTTLAEFLLARVAEDEAAAGVQDPDDTEQWRIGRSADGWPSVSPSRVLAECEAKRRIVELFTSVRVELSEDGPALQRRHGDKLRGSFDALDDALRTLAMPYSDHPDYDESWRL